MDIPKFLEVSKKMTISGAHYPIRNMVAYELLANSCRNEPGDQSSCLQVVAASMRIPGHTTYLLKKSACHPILPELLEAIEVEKKESLLRLLEQHKVDHFACRSCLEDYIQLCEDPEELMFRKQHIQSLMDLIRSENRFHFFVADVCPSFQFNLKFPYEAHEPLKQKVWYQGKVIRSCPGHAGGKLIGFTTDNLHVVEAFKNELNYILSQRVKSLLDKSSVLDYLQSLVM